jgi:hypothetical protein
MNFLLKYITPKNNVSINPALLWDFGNIEPDYKKSKKIIIWRVVEYGTLDDWNAIFNIYGQEEVILTIKQLSGISQRSLNFVSKLFDLKKTDFKCCTKTQWRKAHWI